MAFFLVFLAAVTLLAFTRARHVESRGLSLFRALFPSWRFFESACHVPVLEYRLLGETGPGGWRPALARQRRGPLTLLLNPRGNLAHACHSLVEQAVSDIGELGDGEEELEGFASSVSYRLVRRLVEHQLAGTPGAEPGTRYQFRVRAEIPGDPAGSVEDVLVSPEHVI